MDDAAIDWLADRSLQALERGEAIAPAVLTLLLRRYAATGRHDIGEALGSTFARVLEDDSWSHDRRAHRPGEDAEWLLLFVEVASFSSDERVTDRVASLTAELRARWPSRGDIGPAMRSIEGCLEASRVLVSPHGGPPLVQAAIDELERIVGLTYQPGRQLAGAIQASPDPPGSLSDHSAAASALLTAFATTGRLPYSMLAEELIETARRLWWDAAAGVFRTASESEPGEVPPDFDADLERFLLNCDLARVLSRLATLHADEDYQRQAVVGSSADYAHDTRSILAALAPAYRTHGLAAAPYALAVAESIGAR